MDQRISLITLGVSDLVRSRAFYARLGWREVEPRHDEVAFFQLNGLALGLYGREALAEDARLPGAGSGFGGIAIAINFASPDLVDAALDEAWSAGGTVLKPAETASWGGYSGYFADPDGHPWELAHNPFCTLHPDGRTEFGTGAG